MVTGRTVLLGIIGNPVEHSLSPTMYNAALVEMELDWIYVPFPVAKEPPERLQEAVTGLAAVGVCGFNVTIPHKEAILPLLSELSPQARDVGAVNTVKRTESGWIGTNTDVKGFMAPLQGRDWSGATAVVLGNGGAARAVVAGCAKLGIAQIWIVGQDQGRINDFAASWSNLRTLRTALSQDKSKLLAQADLLVNATPVGMNPNSNDSPLTENELDLLQAELVYDLIYTPRSTQLLQQARRRGLRVQGGLEMLVQQGAVALAWWTGQRDVPIATMRQAVLSGVSLYLVGMPGSGKSKVGRELAPLLGYQFVDLDAEVERAGQSIRQLVERIGWEEFRDRESQVLANRYTNTSLVVATGGGILLRPKNWNYLGHGLTVWLDVPVEILYKRLQGNTTRPHLQNGDLLRELQTLQEQRQPLYARAADIAVTVRSQEETPSQIAKRILEAFSTAALQ